MSVIDNSNNIITYKCNDRIIIIIQSVILPGNFIYNSLYIFIATHCVFFSMLTSLVILIVSNIKI